MALATAGRLQKLWKSLITVSNLFPHGNEISDLNSRFTAATMSQRQTETVDCLIANIFEHMSRDAP
jgi:hypothetical protein